MSGEIKNYGEFSLGVHERLRGKRSPVAGTIELTYHCNLRCVHCYNCIGPGSPECREDELSTDEHLRILDELAEAGCFWLLLTGGEPLIRKDFSTIYRHAKGLGMLITLFSNGTLVSPHLADFLAEWPPFSIELTLYGASPEVYEAITGREGSFNRFREGLDLLVDRKLPVKLKSMVFTLNLDDISAMRAFARSYGMGLRLDTLLTPRIDGSKEPLGYRLSPEQAVVFDVCDQPRAKTWQKFSREVMSGQPALAETKAELPHLYQCSAGRVSFTIDPYGMLRPCGLDRSGGFDLRNGSFREGWEVFLARVVDQRWPVATRCTWCALRVSCGMCAAYGALENGDPIGPVEYMCEVAHLRAMAMEWPIPAHGPCPFCPGGSRYGELAAAAARIRERANSGAAPERSAGDRSGAEEFESEDQTVLDGCSFSVDAGQV